MSSSTHYSFGGNGEGGALDCSSFTQAAFKKAGIDIGRDTQAQWTQAPGQRIGKDDLQPGDLVFFKDTYSNDHTDGVSHVGIYTGNGQFINNNDSGVQTNNVFSGYWGKHYLGAKRISQ